MKNPFRKKYVVRIYNNSTNKLVPGAPVNKFRTYLHASMYRTSFNNLALFTHAKVEELD